MVPFKPGSNKLMGNEFRKTGGHPVLHVSLRGEISSTFQLVVPGSGKNNMRNAKMLCGGLQAAWQRFSLRGVCLDSLSVQMFFLWDHSAAQRPRSRGRLLSLRSCLGFLKAILGTLKYDFSIFMAS